MNKNKTKEVSTLDAMSGNIPGWLYLILWGLFIFLIYSLWDNIQRGFSRGYDNFMHLFE
jgi:TM2 domain-containing membrane protein YozV